MITPRHVCWTQIASIWNKSITVGENDPDVDHRGWHCQFFSNRHRYLNYQGNKQVCFPRKKWKTILFWTCYQFFFFFKVEAWFITVYKTCKYCHHYPEEGLKRAVAPILMLGKICESSVQQDADQLPFMASELWSKAELTLWWDLGQ